MIKNIGSHWLLLVVTIVATFVLIPFNLAHLGEHNYGLWLIIASFNAYLILLHLGVPMASLRYMTQALAHNDMEEYNRVNCTCMGFYAAVSVIVALLGLVLLVVFQHSYDLEHRLIADTRWAFFLATANVIGSTALLAPQTVLSSYQDFVRMNILRLLAYLIRIAANVILVSLYPSITMIALSLFLGTLFEIVALTTLVHLRYKDVKLLPTQFSWHTVWQVSTFSVFVLILAVGGQLMASTGPIVIGYALGPDKVPLFAIPNSLLTYLSGFIVSISLVILPIATTLQVKGKADDLRHEFLKWTKISFALTACAALYLVVFGPAFLSYWVSPAYGASGASLLAILLFGYLFFLPIRGVAVPILMGIGKPMYPTIAVLIAGICNIILSIVLVGPFGLEGVAWGVAIPCISLAAALAYFACRDLEIPIGQFLRNTLPRSVLGLVVAAPLMWALHYLLQPKEFIGLGIAGVATLIIFTLIWKYIVLRNDEHIVVPPLKELISKSFAR